MTSLRIDWPPSVSPEDIALLDGQAWPSGGAARAWTIVPPVGGSDWRLLVDGREGERRLRELFAAFVGPGAARIGAESTATLVRGESHSEVLVLPVHVLEADHFRRAIERLVAVAGEAPAVVGSASRSLADLLRDFRLALANGAPRQAEALLGELKAHPRLSGANRRHLDVEFHARLGRWTELQARKYVADALKSPAPAQVREWLLAAVWHVDFLGNESTQGPAAVARFQDGSEGLRWALDRVRHPQTPGVVRLAILRAREQGSTARIEELVGHDPDLQAFVASLDAQSPTPEPEPAEVRSPADVAAAFRRDGRIPDLVEHLRAHREDPAVLVESAWAVDEYEATDAYAEVLAYIEEMGPEPLPKSPGFQKLIQRLGHMVEVSCDGWVSWLARVVEGPRWEAAEESARAAANQWAAELVKRPDLVAEAAEYLSSDAGGARDQLEAVLDLMIDLLAELPPTSERQYFVMGIASVLDKAAPSSQLVATLVQLAATALEHGIDEDEYQQIVDCCLRPGLLDPRAHLTDVLDLFDVFVAHHQYPGPFGLLRGAMQASLLSHDSNGNLDRGLVEIAAGLLAEAGAPGVLHLPETGEATATRVGSIWDRLQGKKVFLYTLFAGLGPRFAQKLKGFCPTVEVVTDDSKVSSTKLQQAVAGADYVIVDTRHAAHEATGAIDAVLPKSQQLFPEGKGCSSFLLRLRQELESEAGSQLAA